MRILLIDNYDSFTYNVVALLRQFETVELVIKKNDELAEIDVRNFDRLVVSPGPDLPLSANGLMNFLDKNMGLIPTLGICLGHQAVAQQFGGKLKQYDHPKHGEIEPLTIVKQGTLFKGLPPRFNVGLYHSWYVDLESLPEVLEVTALNSKGIIMAMEHKSAPIYSVQFHPESFMSAYGKEILQNFIYCL